MTEVWIAAAVTVGGAVVSGYAEGKAGEKKAKDDQRNALAQNKDEAKWTGVLSQFNAAQDNYYKQKDRQDKERGLSEFRKWSTVQNYAPAYVQDSNTGIQVGAQPKIEDYLSGGAVGQEAATATQAANANLPKLSSLTEALTKKE